MEGYSLKTRSLFSTWFSLFFFLLLGFYLGFIEFFQDSRIQTSAVEMLKNPIKHYMLENMTSLKFKNRIGEYVLNKEDTGWILQKPRVMPANQKTVDQIVAALKKIQIKTIHENEKINLESFSLNDPTMEFGIQTKLGENIKIDIGLINPIDNTSYMTVTGFNQIYQTNVFVENLGALELSKFIDARVFSQDTNNIKNFRLYHGKQNESFNNLTQKDGQWTSKKYNTISTENTDKKLTDILNLKSFIIIDKRDEKLDTFIGNYLDNPLYRIVVTKKDGKKITYKISNLIKAVPELKLEKRQYFLMNASDRKYPYVISKKHLTKFQIRYSDLRP